MPRKWGGRRPGAGRPPKSKNEGKAVASAARPASMFDLRSMIAATEQIQELAKRGPSKRTHETNPFRLPEFPPAAIPRDESRRMAMDSNLTYASQAWLAGSILNTVAAEGLLFPGYTYLSELAQRPEYRIISETIADDATRKWITFDIAGTEEEEEKRSAEDAEDPDGAETRRKERVDEAGLTDKVQDLLDFLDVLEARDRMYEMIRGDGFFGRMHLHLSFGMTDNLDPSEMRTPVGDGRDDLSKAKVSPQNPLRRLKAIEPVWTYPMGYNAMNPLLEDWYNPQYWYVMGQELHVSRLLPFVSRPVPDILKPAYAFGGLSLSQIAEPYVNIWLRTRQSVADLIHSFSVMVLKTNLSTQLSPGGSDLLSRMALFNVMRDNNGAFVVDKATEDFSNVSAPISGLEGLQAQSQEHMASVSRIPLVKLTGISPSGLNASSEGEIQVYYDTISAFQNRSVRPMVARIVNFAQLSLWSEVDPKLKLGFAPLKEMTEKEKAELQKMQAERDKTFVDMGALSPEEVRVRIINDPELPYGGLDPEDVPEPPAEEGLGGEGGEGGEGEGEGEGGDPFKPTGSGFGKEPGAADAAILPFYPAGADEAWSEEKHPRAPDGKFGSGGSHSSEGVTHSESQLKTTDLKKVGAQMGSNPGGVFEDKSGTRYYVKAGKSTDHVANELLAANLFKLNVVDKDAPPFEPTVEGVEYPEADDKGIEDDDDLSDLDELADL